MATNTTQRAAFLAALTATDQMDPAERQRLADKGRRAVKSRAKDERYVAWMEARAAYHTAAATDVRAIVGRIADMPDQHERNAIHDTTSRAMIVAYGRFMLLPLVGADDAKERRVMIRKGRNAITLSAIRDEYDAAVTEWLAHIEADAARMGRKA